MVPTLLVDVIIQQHNEWCTKERNSQTYRRNLLEVEKSLENEDIVKEETCNALVALSKACQLSEMLSVTEENLQEIDRYVAK